MTGALRRRLVFASAIAVVLTSALLPGSGFGAPAAAAHGIPASLAAAIHARFGAGAIRSEWAARALTEPQVGFSVALSADGTTALVAAPGGFDSPGAAFIFHTSDAGAWSSTDAPTATLLDTPHPAKGELYGWSVALSADGTTAFVGALLTGEIYVFHVSAEDAWASSSTPTATLSVTDDTLGVALGLSSDGTTLVAGAPWYGDNSPGGAYVFHVSSEGAWASTSTPTATLSNAGESDLDGNVGLSVALSADGTTALLSDGSNPNGGGAYVYHVPAEDAWTTSSTPTAILSNSNSHSADTLGNSVAFSGDGTVAVLTAPGVKRPGSGEFTGAIDIFRASGEGAWATTSTPTAILSVADGTEDDMFGLTATVSADGKTVLVTAPGHDFPHGAAYLFHASSEAAWATTSAPTAILVNSGGHTNAVIPPDAPPALSADGTTALNGAPSQEQLTGAADVFNVSDAGSWASTSTPNATLTVGSFAPCVVPKLKGLKVSAAKAALKAGRCALGKVRRVHAKGKKGRVVSQSAKPGRHLDHGAKVAVKVVK